jgi:transposase InsO family protein
VKGQFFYLYLFMDIFSRKIIGWQIYLGESSLHASGIIRDICRRENIPEGQVTLHSDNGSLMKGATMLATLQKLGIMPSLSRPSVSNDNPYSESLFRTLKYRPEYPAEPFETLEEARQWTAVFVGWYNTMHRHSGIQFVTPSQRHAGKDVDILSARKATYQAAKAANPERWSGDIRNWEWCPEVHLNPDNPIQNHINTMGQSVH